MRIGLLTTLEHNIGDDLIRQGVIRVLGEALPDRGLEFVPVNKHKPDTIYPPGHPVHWGRYSPAYRSRVTALLRKALYRFGGSVFDGCDAIVQCGTPVYWRQCHRADWATPIWYQVIGRLSSQVPVLNLAAGACYPWERQPAGFESTEDAAYARDLAGFCRVTTVRDPLAQTLVSTVASEPELLPCAAFLSTGVQPPAADDGLVLVNYMRRGGHYDLRQSIDQDVYERTMKALLGRLSSRHRVAFVCHNAKEESLARELAPELPTIRPGDAAQYAQSVGAVKAAICNRMHAAVALAGMGVPSIAIGTDTRLLMAEHIGIAVRYVKGLDGQEVEDALERMIRERAQYRDRFATLQRETQARYVSIIRETLG